MEIATTFRVHLSGHKDTFSLDGDCVCCGEPTKKIWTYRHQYKRNKWVKNHRVRSRETVRDKDGTPEKGEIEFSLPYCVRHLEQSERLRHYHDKQSTLSVKLMVASVLLYFGWLAVGLPIPLIEEFSFFPKYLITPVVIFFLVLLAVSFVSMMLNEKRSESPDYSDYPLTSNAGGGSGLGLDVKEASSKSDGGYIKYKLVLSFMREEAAQRFKEKYPSAHTVYR